mgnify:CR=1 FL=1
MRRTGVFKRRMEARFPIGAAEEWRINIVGVRLRASGRSGNLMFTLFAFILYFNFLNIGQRWVGSGQLSLSSLLLMLHGSVFLICTVWLIKRQRNVSLRGWLQRRLRSEPVEKIGQTA